MKVGSHFLFLYGMIKCEFVTYCAYTNPSVTAFCSNPMMVFYVYVLAYGILHCLVLQIVYKENYKTLTVFAKFFFFFLLFFLFRGVRRIA
jgi:hypothetical protein